MAQMGGVVGRDPAGVQPGHSGLRSCGLQATGEGVVNEHPAFTTTGQDRHIEGHPGKHAAQPTGSARLA